MPERPLDDERSGEALPSEFPDRREETVSGARKGSHLSRKYPQDQYLECARGQTRLQQVAKTICRRYFRGSAPAGDDQATRASRHGCDRRPRRVPGRAMARSAAGWRLDRRARRWPRVGWGAQVRWFLSNVMTRCLSRSRPARAIAATPPIIAAIGPKDTAASSNRIAEPVRMAATPPNAVDVCRSHCMTGSLPVVIKIWLPGPRADWGSRADHSACSSRRMVV